MAKKSFGIFYIDTNKGYFYGSNSASILQIDFPPDTLSFFDIINRDKFYQLIQNLVTTNKIDPVPLLILISPFATYEKDSATKLPEGVNTDIQQFLDAVPFEKVMSRTYKMQDTLKVIATNKELYDVIKHGFERMQFSIVAVVSLSLLQKVMPDIGTNLNLEVIAGKFESIKQYSFLSHDEINNIGKPNIENTQSTKPNPLRLYGLVGVFVVLIGILIFMVLTTLQPTPKPVVQQAAPMNAVVSTPTPAPLEETKTIKGVTPSEEPLSPTPLITPTSKEVIK